MDKSDNGVINCINQTPTLKDLSDKINHTLTHYIIIVIVKIGTINLITFEILILLISLFILILSFEVMQVQRALLMSVEPLPTS